MDRCIDHPARARRRFRFFRRLGLMLAFDRDRRALSRLEPRLLRDIGLTADQVRAELEKPVWDVPKNWLR
ncbi:hypothetical protein OEW28_05605 [Defluviimonas sp. WL0002]|uniref:DUF1127 domain-containing protein n=1 Tax=Albidovulum marisflavi TaxID=2984159 RepID=A0ABT2ZAI7_9RHOB|nr:hypothetical protein [Defluviimonas sp. WL0002]MCV2868098.1 hypothetical protein [Defluviimonas sp. WL0002]